MNLKQFKILKQYVNGELYKDKDGALFKDSILCGFPGELGKCYKRAYTGIVEGVNKVTEDHFVEGVEALLDAIKIMKEDVAEKWEFKKMKTPHDTRTALFIITFASLESMLQNSISGTNVLDPPTYDEHNEMLGIAHKTASPVDPMLRSKAMEEFENKILARYGLPTADEYLKEYM